VVDVADVSTSDNAPAHLWSYGGDADQEWLPVDGGGSFHRAPPRPGSTPRSPPDRTCSSPPTSTSSKSLLEVGPAGVSASHAAVPTSLHDVCFRIGGAGVGKAATSLVGNSEDASPAW
jgi:hypothetical protein